MDNAKSNVDWKGGEMTEDMRERFEKWLLSTIANWGESAKKAKVHTIIGKDRQPEYTDGYTNAAWDAWQAALSSAGTSGTPNVAVASLLLEAEGRWIPVSERLPERLVIVKAKGYDMPFVAELLRTKLGEPIIREGGYQWKIQSPFAVGLTSEVTHWCDAALPAPPREEG